MRFTGAGDGRTDRQTDRLIDDHLAGMKAIKRTCNRRLLTSMKVQIGIT